MDSDIFTKDDLITTLEEKQQLFIRFLEQQALDAWEIRPHKKWTTGQQALHLLKSIVPINNILSLPKFYLTLKYKKNARPIRGYSAIVDDFNYRVKNDPVAIKQFSKNTIPPKQRDKTYVLNRLQVESKKLQYKIKKFTDEQLDTIVLPHSLLGDIPVRELLMWKIYHIEYHYKELQDHYKALSNSVKA